MALDNGRAGFERGGIDVCRATAAALGSVHSVSLRFDSVTGASLVLGQQGLRNAVTKTMIGTVIKSVVEIVIEAVTEAARHSMQQRVTPLRLITGVSFLKKKLKLPC